MRARTGGDLNEGLYQRLSFEAWQVVRAAQDPPASYLRYVRRHRGPGRGGPKLLFDWLGYGPDIRRRVQREIRVALSRGVA